ncbi:MAG: Sphingobium phage Lacusarx [Pseudomonadota bacterium]
MLGPARYTREELDLYETPAWCTRTLLDHLAFQRVWEPACGLGAISKVLEAEGIDVASTDVVDRGYGSELDFLVDGHETSRDIITNPPYSLADDFVRQALKLTERHQAGVAMLMRHEWDAGVTRDDLLVPGSRYWGKLVLTDRPRWFADSSGRPRHAYAWYIWSGKPVLFPRLLRGR